MGPRGHHVPGGVGVGTSVHPRRVPGSPRGDGGRGGVPLRPTPSGLAETPFLVDDTNLGDSV